jgi:hypothetical protein
MAPLTGTSAVSAIQEPQKGNFYRFLGDPDDPGAPSCRFQTIWWSNLAEFRF